MAKLGIIKSPLLLERPSQGFKFRRDLTDIEYDQFKTAIFELDRYSSMRELLIFVEFNHEAFHKYLISLGSEFESDLTAAWEESITHDQYTDMVLKCHFFILNFLNSVNEYLAQAERLVKEYYGENSDCYSQFKKQIASEHINTLSFRFLLSLKQFYGRCGKPSANLKIRAENSYAEIEQAKMRIDVILLRDNLLMNAYDWEIGRSDLLALPEEIELTHHMNEMLNSLRKIDYVISRSEAIALLPQLKFLESLEKEVKRMKGIPCVFTGVSPCRGTVKLHVCEIKTDVIRGVKRKYASQKSFK